MNFEYLEETIIDQIEILTEELGGKMSKSTRHDYTGRSSKIITIEYDITESQMSDFIQRHIGPTTQEQTQMLNDLGLSTIEELVREVVPTSILLRGDDDLPEPCSEQQALEELKEIANHNVVRLSLIHI